jgi:signal transduction histidine kinase
MHAKWRLLASTLVAAGIVVAFGGIALREQRKELALAAELGIAAAHEERQAELLRADKLVTLGTFATGVTHEIATPLGVIAGRAEQLRSRFTDDPRSARALGAIITETERIEQIIRSFLSLARGEAPNTQIVDPADVVREAQHLVEHRFRKAGVELSVTVPERLCQTACDPNLMVQVLVNLMLNACDACERGGAVRVRASTTGAKVELVVEDEGVGISEEAARRATEPFFTTKPAERGSGLGLAIANEIVKHHRGVLQIGPRKEGRGTIASVSLPVVESGGAA